jgi:16S rRNA (cytosine967-C5)-methyltransferase
MVKYSTNSRFAAAGLLSKFDPMRENLSDTLAGGSFVNRAGVTDYAFGVLRNIVCIDTVLSEIADVKASRVEPVLLNSLRIAVYELIYKPATPEYAVINEAVSPYSARHKRGFINAVLRNIQRHIACRDQQYVLCGEVVPVKDDRGCRFTCAVAPDPGKSLTGYLSRVFSLPRWLLDGWLVDYGRENLFEICMASNRCANVYIRPNSTLVTASELYELFDAAKVQCEITPEGLIVVHSFGPAANVFSLPGYEEGLFCVQDKTAARVAELIAPKPGDVIIDMCAAPGTKTTHLAELLKGTGRVIATDINPERLKLVEENAKRLRLDNIEIIDYEDIASFADSLPRISAVLIDAPCSNTGVLAKRLEVRNRLTRQSVEQLADIGLSLLKAAVRLNSCEQIFYSTCSIEKSENAQVLHKLFHSVDFFEKKAEYLALPSSLNHGCDGGYVAKLARKKPL